jgi:hypothetical protein
MWKICDKEKTEAEALMLKLFKFLGTAKDLSSIGEALIKYEAALKVQELKADIKEDAAEMEEDMSSLFDVKED